MLRVREGGRKCVESVGARKETLESLRQVGGNDGFGGCKVQKRFGILR